MSILQRNNVRVIGQGKQPMLFAHGFGCDQNMWRHVWPAFEKDYQIVLFDHVGAGRSDQSHYDRKKYGALQGYAQDILEICNELHLQKVIFVGHSVSAMMGVIAAGQKPELFDQLILIGPSPRYLNDGEYVGGFTPADIDGLLLALDSNYLGWSSQMAPVIMGVPEHPEFGNELKESFCRTNPEIAKHFARVTFLSDNRADLSGIKTPTLILQCSKDVIAPDAVGDYVHGRIPGSQLVRLKATGHCPNVSAPEETVAAMKDFLAFSLSPHEDGSIPVR